MSGKYWEKREIKFLKKHYPQKGAAYTAKHINRSVNSIISKAMLLGITKEGFRRWEIWEDMYIKRHYSDRKTASIGRTLKRSVHAVTNHAKKLGLTKPRARNWTEEEKDFLRKHYHDRSIPLEQMASRLNRSVKSIRAYVKFIKAKRPRHNHEWTQDEHNYLAANYKHKRFKDIAVDLGLSKDAVVLYANRKGFFRKSRRLLWSDQEIEFVRQNYSTMTAEDIGNQINRSVQAVRQCAGRLGLQNKDNWYKPANVEARVRKFKLWLSNQKQSGNVE